MDLKEIFASKKFVLVILFAILGTILVIADKTTADVFFKFMELVAGGYLIGNVSDKINDSRVEIQDIKTNK